MSKAIEAAAKALFEESQELDQDNDWDDPLPDEWREAWKSAARETLSAALPHLTEGLAEVLRTHTCEYGDCACGWHPTLGDDDLAKHQAAAITEELKRRIEE